MAQSTNPGRSPVLTEAAPAKINLALHVLGRRADGYHLLDSLVVFAGVGDTLTATEADDLSLSVVGPFAAGLNDTDDNLVLRAARLLAAEAGVAPRARVALDKRLPIASGIGGGSADAAAALRLLARLWRLDSPPPDLALRLGADVPVCLAGRPARMAGVGENLGPAPTLPPCGLVLLNPGVPVATAEVFRARTGGFSAPLVLPAAWPDAATMAADLSRGGNDLEPPARRLQPAIDAALAALRSSPACLLARMSGSGATCWALCADAPTASIFAESLRRPGWWVWGGALAG
jgi:4-diphosphocytidyl-2-C-methyl-D-erythritol kinase